VWWHAQAGQLGARRRTELGVDALSLTQDLNAVLAEIDANQIDI
jgi:NAD(P)H-hydrate repair Nnr-like enzyme with NAD(P)H-hydrate dehydratase domain